MSGLSFAIWMPILIGLGLLIAGEKVDKYARVLAALTMLITLGVVAGLTAKFDSSIQSFQFAENREWIASLGIRYSVGLDGISIWMFWLTALLGVVAVVIAKPNTKIAQFYGQLLLLSGTLLGAFAALDLVLFYILFELSLVPVALLILGWGKGDRQKAATRYLAMLFGGSLLMLAGIVVLSVRLHELTRGYSTNLVEIQSLVASGQFWAGQEQLENLTFWGFLIAFLVKSPAVPGHTWLASTYESAPVSATVAGVVLKLGTYGLFRFCLPLFPHAAAANAPFVTMIGVVGILYGGILAINQKNIFRVMAFSTVSHVGFILIGLFSLSHIGMVGAAFQQFNHGLASAAVFVLFGFLVDRGYTGEFSEMGGLKKSMPILASMFMIAMLANLGLPVTSGFVGEFLALLGCFQAGYAGVSGMSVAYASFAGIGAILSAAYMLYAYQRMFYGEATKAPKGADLSTSEMLVGAVFGAAILVGGLCPTTVLSRMDQSVAMTGSTIQPGTKATWQTPDPSISQPKSFYALQTAVEIIKAQAGN